MKHAMLLGFDIAAEVHVKLRFFHLFDNEQLFWVPSPVLVGDLAIPNLLFYLKPALAKLDSRIDPVVIISTPDVNTRLSGVLDDLERGYGSGLIRVECPPNDKGKLQLALETHLEAVPKPRIADHVIESILGHKEILCVRLISSTRVAALLARANLVRAGLKIKEVGFHNTKARKKVNQLVRDGAATFSRLLYASEGLGPLESTTLAKWGNRAHVGLHAIDVVQSLFRFLLNEQNRLELEAARDAQSLQLSQPVPVVPGFSFSIHQEPAQMVAGDFYLIEKTNDGVVAVAIGDVTGEGAGAGTFAMSLYGRLKLLTDRGAPPPEVCRELNRNILSIGSDCIRAATTLFYGLLDPRSRTLTYCNAGHPPPRMRRASGEVITLDPDGLALGYLENTDYKACVVTMEAGDRLILLTDGFIELPKASQIQFGDRALANTLRDSGGLDAEKLKGAIVEAALRFAPRGFDDDGTLIVVACDYAQ
ncbi:MAG: PP2C family protein-serine/threonine phosphatase [Terriglobia bacterium]